MKKLITLTAIILCTIGTLFAETLENRKENPHEIRIGIADSYMEACLENYILSDFPTCVPILYENGPLNHTGHIFTEYQYRVNNWFSAGLNIDYLHSWHYQYLYKTHEKIINQNIKLSLIPTLRFTYFHNEIVNLYSAFGLGFNYAYYNDDKYHTVCAAFDICALGVSIGKKHWFGAFELGGTTSIGYPIEEFKDEIMIGNYIEMPIPFARLLRISVGYRF
jgi:hypothetical protein